MAEFEKAPSPATPNVEPVSREPARTDLMASSASRRAQARDIRATLQAEAGPQCQPAAPPVPGINKPGFIDHPDGANIRTGPAEAGGETLTPAPLPPATGVFVSGTHPDTADWLYVSAAAPAAVVLGYVQHFRVNTALPEAGARLYVIRPGDTAEAIAAREFKGAIRPGHDLRYYENVLLHVNREAGRDGVRGSYQSPTLTGGGSNNVQLVAGQRIWLPSPAHARALEGTVPDGSFSNGAYAEVKQALAHIEDILASVTRAPGVAAEVAGEYLEVIRAHLPEIIAVVGLFIAAESASTLLAASPTGVGQLAALAIQLILAVFIGKAVVDTATAALTHASKWLTMAWTAKGDDKQITEASKEFVRMLVMIAMAALAVAGLSGTIGKAGQLTGSIDVQLPRVAMMTTPEGALVPQMVPGQIATAGPVTLTPGLGAGPQVGTTHAMSTNHGNGGGDRGTAKSQYTNADAKAAAEANGYRASGKTNSSEIIYYKSGGNPPYIVRSRTGHSGEMFKGFKSLKDAQAGRTSKEARLGGYDANLNRIAD